MSNQSPPLVNAVLPEDLYIDILPDFIREIDEMINQINQTFENRNEPDLKAAAHKIFGSALSYGAGELARLSQAIEKLDGLKNIEDEGLIELLNDEWLNVLRFCEHRYGIKQNGQ